MPDVMMHRITRIPNAWSGGLTLLLTLVFANPTFAQDAAPSDPPVLVDPVDQAQIIDTTTAVVLEWDVVDLAATYEVQLYYSEPITGLEPIPLKTKVLSDSTQELLVTDLLDLIDAPASDNDSTFHWRVRARNSSGEGPWSDVWEFTLVPPDNQTPTWTTIVADSVEIEEEVPYTFTVLAEDAESDPITYSIDAASEALGMGIDAETGEFSWTPGETQGPSTYPVTFSASDGTSTVDSTVAIVVLEVNLAPALVLPADTVRGVDNTLLTFDVDATDPDTLAPEPFTFNTLTFSLDTPPDPGMAIDPATGVFTWTPPAPDTVDVSIIVTDDGEPVMADTQLVTIVVEPATCPRIAAVEPQSIAEGDTLQLTLQASNECPAGAFTFGLDQASLDQGMTLDAATGALGWITGETDGPDVYTVTASVNDGNVTNSLDFTVTVSEVNLPPVLDLIGDQSVDLGQSVLFTATATDPDTLAPEPFTFNELTFSLENPGDPGMAIDPTSGEFTWTPSVEGTFPVTVIVSDGGDPDMSASETINIVVVGVVPPVTTILTTPFCSAEDVFALDWDPVAVESYMVEIDSDPNFSNPIIIETTESEAEAPLASLDEGTTYFWRVISVNQGLVSRPSDSLRFKRWPAQIQVQNSLNFTKATESNDFRMISLPGAPSVAISSTFSGQQAASGPLVPGGDWNWSVWRDNGSTSAYPGYVVNPVLASDTFEPGRGFWAISTSSWTVPQTSVAAVTLVGNAFFAIPLNQAPLSQWTMIGNPFDFPVAWQDIIDANPDITGDTELWDWTGQSYQQVTVLEPYKGYYFFNRDDRAQLDMPCFLEPASGKVAAREEQRIASLELSLFEDQNASLPAVSNVTLTWQEDAKEGLDRFDQHAPPAFFESAQLSLVNKAFETGYDYLNREARPSLDDSQQFDLELKATPGEPAYLRIAGLENLAAQQVYLFDDELGRSFNLHENPVVLLEPEREVSKLRLLIGDADFISAEESKLLPDGFKLQQSYPNPFTDQTTIEFALPDPEFVSIEVYNVIGQRVRTLVHGEQDAGYHRVSWDGRSDSGEDVASGMYLYVLKSASYHATERLIRVR